MDQTLIMMVLAFFTGEPTAVLGIVFAGCITQDQVSCRHTFNILFPSLCHCNLA
jgi:hypothetical protein